MDIYEEDDDNNKKYYECSNWFDLIASNIEFGNISYLNGIKFFIYRRKMSGKFYGKIQ